MPHGVQRAHPPGKAATHLPYIHIVANLPVDVNVGKGYYPCRGEIAEGSVYRIPLLRVRYSSLNSLGVHFLKALNTRLKVEMLEKPDCSAISVIGREGSTRRFSAALIRPRFR